MASSTASGHAPGQVIAPEIQALLEQSGTLEAAVARLSPLSALAKRGLDIVVAGAGLVAGAPVLVALAILIKRESPGPALFSQWRLGQGCRPFRFYKLRTMYSDWPTRFPELARLQFDQTQLEQVFLQLEHDPRVTPLGRFLRRSSLDELPNLWNILVGQMSLVGPRPELPEMLPYYPDRAKFAVKPGLTGAAQISGRGQLNFLDTLALDRRYVETRSLRADLRILAETVRTVISGRGAY